MGKKRIHNFPALAVLLILVPTLFGFGTISRNEFFDRLEQFLGTIRTFQADILQESRFPDGIVQRYSGKLYVSEDGRIAYDYDLIFEGEDPSLIPESKGSENEPRERIEDKSPNRAAQGVYITKGPKVVHYDTGRNVLIESPEEENLLIQLFRALVGQGDFDVKKFRQENKVLRISEKELDGVPVYVMMARPKKNSELYRQWSSRSGNRMLDWKQELWVKQSTMEPVRLALHSAEESTIIYLKSLKINEPVDPNVFLIHPQSGGLPPRKISRGSLTSGSEWTGNGPTLEKPLEEIPLEEP